MHNHAKSTTYLVNFQSILGIVQIFGLRRRYSGRQPAHAPQADAPGWSACAERRILPRTGRFPLRGRKGEERIIRPLLR